MFTLPVQCELIKTVFSKLITNHYFIQMIFLLVFNKTHQQAFLAQPKKKSQFPGS